MKAEKRTRYLCAMLPGHRPCAFFELYKPSIKDELLSMSFLKQALLSLSLLKLSVVEKHYRRALINVLYESKLSKLSLPKPFLKMVTSSLVEPYFEFSN